MASLTALMRTPEVVDDPNSEPGIRCPRPNDSAQNDWQIGKHTCTWACLQRLQVEPCRFLKKPS